MSHGPIEEKHKHPMYALAKTIEECFPGIGFCLFMFDFGDKGRMNYVSNAKREDMITAMKEFIANAEGRMHEPPKSKQ